MCVVMVMLVGYEREELLRLEVRMAVRALVRLLMREDMLRSGCVERHNVKL